MDPTWNILGTFPGIRDQKPSNNGLFYGTFLEEMIMNPLNAVHSILSSRFAISICVTLLHVSSFPKLLRHFSSSAKFGINKRQTKWFLRDNRTYQYHYILSVWLTVAAMLQIVLDKINYRFGRKSDLSTWNERLSMWVCWICYVYTSIQIRSKDSQVKTQFVLWIFILFKVTRWQHVSASITRPSSGH